MKYVVVLGDGMADWPMEDLNGGTPLSCAETPCMDELAKVSENRNRSYHSRWNGTGK